MLGREDIKCKIFFEARAEEDIEYLRSRKETSVTGLRAKVVREVVRKTVGG